MKHVPRVKYEKLTPNLQRLLDARRTSKNFDAEAYVNAKVRLLEAYFTEQSLKTALIAMSGGVDSAIVLGILLKVARGNKGFKVVPITLPASDEVGATRQSKTLELVSELAKWCSLPIYKLDIHSVIDKVQLGISDSTELFSTPWARGQSVAYARTATLYSLTAALSDQARTVLVGTTNRDEGSYLGYIGKASDGMVDIQPISDLHKSEVYKVAEYLGIPQSIIWAVPTGDMFDGRTDEEVFGAPYNFVELYTTLLHTQQAALDLMCAVAFDAGIKLETRDLEQYQRFALALEELHTYNRHKYIGSSPAVHLDLTPFDLPDGWQTNCRAVVPLMAQAYCGEMIEYPIQAVSVSQIENNGQIKRFSNVIDMSMVEKLTHFINASPGWKRADKYGKPATVIDASGSDRKNRILPDLAELIYARLGEHLPLLYAAESDLTQDGLAWTRTGLNPMFRFIKYGLGDWLVPHYDDAYRASEVERSLMSVVIYLTSGSTRFLREHRHNHNYEDQQWAPLSENVLLTVDCKPGDVLVFDHRLLHDCPLVVKSDKLIIRSDIMYQRPQLGRALKAQSA